MNLSEGDFYKVTEIFLENLFELINISQQSSSNEKISKHDLQLYAKSVVQSQMFRLSLKIDVLQQVNQHLLKYVYNPEVSIIKV